MLSNNWWELVLIKKLKVWSWHKKLFLSRTENPENEFELNKFELNKLTK